jgi:hypothetical protein
VTLPFASFWTDAGAAIIALFAGAIAVFWPWLQALHRGRKFESIIRRELEEIGPHLDHPDARRPWWEYATKRFVHEEIFHRNNISQNRDFLMSLDATVVYQVSQLWIALEKRDGNQWLYFLDELASNRRVGSPALRSARDKWKTVIKAQRDDWLETMGLPSVFRQEAVLARTQPLFERRFEAYGRLLPLTDYGPENHPKQLDLTQRELLAEKLSDWFYEKGAGLLLSGRALEQFNAARNVLRTPNARPEAVRKELSGLRTDLKIDLGVRQPRERDVAMAWPEDERW